MRTIKALMGLLFSLALVACGGGGADAGTAPFGTGSGTGTGGTGGTPTAAPTLTLSLQDTNGNAISTNTLTGTQNAVVVARVLDAGGQPVPNILVAVTASSVTMTPATGQTKTTTFFLP